jgi:integrase
MDELKRLNKQGGELAPTSLLEQAGQAANKAAGAVIFADYQARKASNTLRRHKADLALFADFLASVGVSCGDLQNEPAAWRGVTWGLVKAFQVWQVENGYALPSVNGRVSTVKVYAKLAAQAGVIDPNEIILIRSVSGYARKEQKHINEKRIKAGFDTRKGAKKSDPVFISTLQAKVLKMQPETPQGRRDSFLLCILLNLGLRVGEAAALTVGSFNLGAAEITFYRPKIDKWQTHKLDAETLDAAKAYFLKDAPALGIVWRKSAMKRDGKAAFSAKALTGQGMSDRAITKRVGYLGAKVGALGLSAHDCRHHWATVAARSGTPIERLQEAGGWASLAMPMRYIEAAKVANQGVLLSKAAASGACVDCGQAGQDVRPACDYGPALELIDLPLCPACARQVLG